MTDAEIRKQLAETCGQYMDATDGRHLVVDFKGGMRLLLVTDNVMPLSATHRLRDVFRHAVENGTPVLLDGAFRVYQLVDGEWRKL